MKSTFMKNLIFIVAILSIASSQMVEMPKLNSVNLKSFTAGVESQIDQEFVKRMRTEPSMSIAAKIRTLTQSFTKMNREFTLFPTRGINFINSNASRILSQRLSNLRQRSRSLRRVISKIVTQNSKIRIRDNTSNARRDS